MIPFVITIIIILLVIIIKFYFLSVLTRDAFRSGRGIEVKSTMGWWWRLMVLSFISGGLHIMVLISAGAPAILFGAFALPILALPVASCAWIIGGGWRSHHSRSDSPPQPQEPSVESQPGTLKEGELEEFWHVSDGDEELGAMTAAQIHTFLRLNKMSRDAFVYRPEHGRWLTLEEAGFCQ